MVKRSKRVLALCLSLSGCLDVAEHRARVDAEVGQATTPAGLSVAVTEGLAAVRSLAPGVLHLWAGAPELQVTLTGAPAGTTFRLHVENVMPAAELQAGNGNTTLTPSLDANPHPTDKTWSFATTSADPVYLRIAVADQADTTPFRHAVYADVQDAIGKVQDIYRRMNAEPDIRFAIMSGDLTERGTVSELTRFQGELKTLAFPCFSTLGNHELGDRDDRYHAHFGRGNRTFTFHGARFTLLDSASATIAPQVYDWLDDWLARGRDTYHAVFMHIPPFDPAGLRNGAFASRAEANLLVGRLARAGVDQTVYGHIHSFYAYKNAGIPAFVTGGGGGIPERLDQIGRHFLVVDVNPLTQGQRTAIVHVD